LLNHEAKNEDLKERMAYYTTLQRYAGLHACDEEMTIPKFDGVLESRGVCELNSSKYFVSDFHIGYSFKNLMA
jgi:hypothetical protein